MPGSYTVSGLAVLTEESPPPVLTGKCPDNKLEIAMFVVFFLLKESPPSSDRKVPR